MEEGPIAKKANEPTKRTDQLNLFNETKLAETLKSLFIAVAGWGGQSTMQ